MQTLLLLGWDSRLLPFGCHSLVALADSAASMADGGSYDISCTHSHQDRYSWSVIEHLIVPAGIVVRSGLYRSEDGESIRSVIFQLCGGCLCCRSSSHSTCGEVHAIFSVIQCELSQVDYHLYNTCTSLLCAPSLIYLHCWFLMI